MLNPAEEVKQQSNLSTDGLEEIFDVSGTPGTKSGTPEPESRTREVADPGQPGHDSIEAVVTTYISTSDAARLAGVDSRTIRRWHEQKKIRGQFHKGKLQIAKEDILSAQQQPEVFETGTPGTESGTTEDMSGTPGNESPGHPGHPGQSVENPLTPMVVFADFLDRIERLSKENGELRAMLEEQRRDNQQLRLLTASQNPEGFWSRLRCWLMGAKS